MSSRSRRYANWIDRHRRLVLATGALLAVIGGWMAAQLRVHTDFSYLLPPNTESVQHLRSLEKRVRTFGTIYFVVESRDPATRKAAADALFARLQALDPTLVGSVTIDDGVARRFAWQHRFLYADLDDLITARDALADRLRRAKLAANPLFVDLDDDAGDGDAPLESQVDHMLARLDDAKAKVDSPPGRISPDQVSQLIILRSTAPTSRIEISRQLVDEVEVAVEATREEFAGIEIGLAGDVVSTLWEHDAVLTGMQIAALITVLLCYLALYFYYRTMLSVLASLISLAVGTLTTFGLAFVFIGHLNIMTAFLAAIVVGNGVNTGLILLSRYFEEVREGRPGNDGLGNAISGAMHGTLAAALAAGVAYGSLIVTEFRGFRDFGWIGGIGMVLCWISAFTVLPAALCELRARGRVRPVPEPALGRWLARAFPRRIGLTVITAGILTVVAGLATYRYVASNPLEDDWRNLRSWNDDIAESRRWDRRMGEQFDNRIKAGLSQRFVIGLERRDQAEPLADMLDGVGKELIDGAASLDDLLPADQDQKLAVLGEIRGLLADPAVDQLPAADLATVDRLRPPDDLRALTDDDLPEAVAWPFIEADGSRGKLVLVRGSLRFQGWNVAHRVEFADGVRALDMPEGAVIGGQSFVIADILESMTVDGPLASAVAVLGAIFAVWLVVGMRRHGLVTLLCGAGGILGMVALCSAVGLKVNFLDLIALPITIGIGIDYSVNLATRERESHRHGPAHLLRTTGGAVLLCSFTTIVGYGSLLLSANAGIRSFGLAAILGEFACIAAALLVAPSLLTILRRRAERARDGGGHPVVQGD